MSNQTQLADTVLRLPQVLARVGISRSQVIRMIAAGSFPAPIHVSSKIRGWLESEITDFVDRCAKQRTSKPRKSAAVADQLVECLPEAQ
jgi:prophage regulatory protein